MNYTVHLEPGKTEAVSASGDYFAVVFAAQDIEIRLPGETPDVYAQGDSIEMPLLIDPSNGAFVLDQAGNPKRQQFRRLEIRNPHADAALDVVLYVGFGRYVQRRQQVLEPKTEAECQSGSVLANGTHALPPLLTNGRIRRKEITISNGSPELRLYWRDRAAASGGFILPGYSVALPVSEYLELYNPAGAAVEFYATSIYWRL